MGKGDVRDKTKNSGHVWIREGYLDTGERLRVNDLGLKPFCMTIIGQNVLTESPRRI